mmetsp:Transcript_29848/g.94138  ORF Transcript_29848/g.94138 Transcript_29848/m.94138 type:complete len:253 (-) Transcript_29848:1021-1779(-)
MSSASEDVEEAADLDMPDHMDEWVTPKELKPAEEAESLEAPSEASDAAMMRCMPSPSAMLAASEIDSASSSLRASRSARWRPPGAPASPRSSLAGVVLPEARMRRPPPLCRELASLASSLLPVVESRSPRMRPESLGGRLLRRGGPPSSGSPRGEGGRSASSSSRRSRTTGRSWPSRSVESVPCPAAGRAMERISQSRKSIQRWRWVLASASWSSFRRAGEAPKWNHAIAWCTSMSLETCRCPRRPCLGSTA